MAISFSFRPSRSAGSKRRASRRLRSEMTFLRIVITLYLFD
jgi:hypothetical protein